MSMQLSLFSEYKIALMVIKGGKATKRLHTFIVCSAQSAVVCHCFQFSP